MGKWRTGRCYTYSSAAHYLVSVHSALQLVLRRKREEQRLEMGVRGNPNEDSTQLQILVHALPPVLVIIHADVFYLACT